MDQTPPMAYAATPEPVVEKPRATAAVTTNDRTASIPARVEKPVAQKPAAPEPAAKPADPLDALEEEMAKLLGRPPGQK